MLSFELTDKILQYVDSTITIAQLEDWLVPRLPFLARNSEGEDSDLVAAVELGLAELGNGIRSEDNLRNFLRKVIQEKASLRILYQPNTYPPTIVGSSSRTVSVGILLSTVQFASTVVAGREQ
jgi:hypothetical protein